VFIASWTAFAQLLPVPPPYGSITSPAESRLASPPSRRKSDPLTSHIFLRLLPTEHQFSFSRARGVPQSSIFPKTFPYCCLPLGLEMLPNPPPRPADRLVSPAKEFSWILFHPCPSVALVLLAVSYFRCLPSLSLNSPFRGSLLQIFGLPPPSGTHTRRRALFFSCCSPRFRDRRWTATRPPVPFFSPKTSGTSLALVPHSFVTIDLLFFPAAIIAFPWLWPSLSSSITSPTASQ